MRPKVDEKLKRAIRKLRTPFAVQEFVSRIPYNPEDYCRSAERAFLEHKAHCLEGALLAALILEVKFKFKPQLLHMRSHRDDDHVVAVFKEKSGWGAVGKSNTTLLGWRDPIYKSVESLLHSYFPFYFNTKGQMSLYSWTGPIQLTKPRYEKWNWRAGRDDLQDMGRSFYDEKERRIYSIRAIEELPRASSRVVEACFLGADPSGLYKV